jgi:sulfoxide reductase heme-binding subunit YedZ
MPALSLLRAQWWVVVLCLLPLAYLIFMISSGQLGSADPGRQMVKFLGLWAIRLLLICLLIRPLSQLLSLPDLHPARRTLGLFALFYTILHALAWAGAIVGFSPEQIVPEIIDNP